jgi:acid phosphatase type 7
MKLVAICILGVLALGLTACVGETDPATDVGSTSATLRAHGYSNDGPARWWWEYSANRTTVENDQAPEVCDTVGSDGVGDPGRCGPAEGGTAENPAHLSVRVVGLQPGTTYYFRACGQDVNDSSATCAQIRSFTTSSANDPVIAAAGDIACHPSNPAFNNGAGTSTACRQRATSDLLVNSGLTAVLPLGDLQYENGLLAEFQAVYHPTWGRVKSITRPVLGNHENDGAGYFDYFNGSGAANGPAGPRGKGWYSYDIGSWRLIALNSNCSRVACTEGSEQVQFLRNALATNPRTCTLAYWHHPRWSSGHDGNNQFVDTFWRVLAAARADVVLVSHSHNYERFAPQNASGGFDANGVREFVVGTGGRSFTGRTNNAANSQLFNNQNFGVLRLTLHPSSYDWRFVSEAGRSFTDSGSDSCH